MSFFVFKQKTEYEVCISDWSSDVCSSDLCGRNWPAAGTLAGGAIAKCAGARGSCGTGSVLCGFCDDQTASRTRRLGFGCGASSLAGGGRLAPPSANSGTLSSSTATAQGGAIS